jgi:hypothetical protein
VPARVRDDGADDFVEQYRGGHGMGTGNKTLTVTGQILQATFQNAAVGTYTGSMTVSVTP